MLLNVVRQRQGLKDEHDQIGAIFEQEKQQIQHDAEAHGKAECPFTNQERATGQILPAFQGGVRELFLNLLCAVKVMFGEKASGPLGQMGKQVCHHHRKLGVIMLKPGVNQV